MEYKVIAAITLDELTQAVNDSMAFGWKPQGGLTVIGAACYQAMVRDDVLLKADDQIVGMANRPSGDLTDKDFAAYVKSSPIFLADFRRASEGKEKTFCILAPSGVEYFARYDPVKDKIVDVARMP